LARAIRCSASELLGGQVDLVFLIAIGVIIEKALTPINSALEELRHGFTPGATMLPRAMGR